MRALDQARQLFGDVAPVEAAMRARFVQAAFRKMGHDAIRMGAPEGPVSLLFIVRVPDVGKKAVDLIAPLRPVWSREHWDKHVPGAAGSAD